MAVVVGDVKKTLEKLRRLQAAPTATVFSGVPAGKEYPDGTNMAQVLFWLEYGTKHAVSDVNELGEGGEDTYHIPPRPVLRVTGDINGPRWNDVFWKYFVENNFDVQYAANVLGDEMAGTIRDAMWTWNYPPNAPSTIAKKKGVNSPLRDTKALLGAIAYKVKIGGSE